jgi:hypothetical protein
VDRRDLLSTILTNLSESLQILSSQMTTTRSENMKAMLENRELASTLAELVEQAKEPDLNEIEDETLRNALQDRRIETMEARRQRRIVKSVVSAVIVGSGIDWASNEEFCSLVMDDED